MEKKKITVDEPVSVAGLTIVTVNQISINLGARGPGAAVMAFKRPLAIVVFSPLKKRAFRITGEEVSLEELIQQIPDLKKLLKY